MKPRLSLLVLVGLNSLTSVNARSWPESQALAAQLVSKMTLEDKLKVLKGQGMFTGPCVGTTSEVTNLVHFPAICMQDGPAGLREVDDLVSAFPAGISVAATWNRNLMRSRGQALGQEWKAKGAHVFLGPAADVTRAQQGGRAWESFGADPYLNGEAAYETIMGVQSQGVQACVKHFIGYQQEQYRFVSTTKMDNQTLRELYFRPFQRAIDAEVACVMCAYNQFNGEWSCRNPALTGDEGLLRKEGGFQGYVVSDWGASHGLTVGSVQDSVAAGLDIEMPGGFIVIGGGVYDKLQAAVETQKVSQASVDKMVTRFISAWFKVNQDQGFPAISFDVHQKDRNKKLNVRSDEHTKLIREIAAASAVLLQNTNGALPLSSPPTLALIGLDAGPITRNDCDMNACSLNGTITVGWGSGTNSLKYVVPPAVAIQDFLLAKNLSTKLHTSLTNDIKSAVAAARSSEVAVVFVYTFSGEIGAGFTSVEGNLGDRTDLNLFGKGEELIKAVAAVNKKTIVVIHSVGSIVMETWVDLPGVVGIIMAGLPGEQTGPAIADVLFGDVNPSGRLPYTIARNEDDFGVKVLSHSLLNGIQPTIDYKEGIMTDYRRFQHLNTNVRFCFGYGLSYTTFKYSQLSISRTSNGQEYSINFQVINTGARDGTEIAQLYMSFPLATGQPPKQLRGFDSVFIPIGHTKSVTLLLPIKDMRLYDLPSGQWKKPDGKFHVHVGASVAQTYLESELEEITSG